MVSEPPPTIKYRYHSLFFGSSWASALHYYLTSRQCNKIPEEDIFKLTGDIASLPNNSNKDSLYETFFLSGIHDPLTDISCYPTLIEIVATDGSVIHVATCAGWLFDNTVEEAQEINEENLDALITSLDLHH
jgi:hypothetical protein